MTYFILCVVALLPVTAFAGYVALSIWFDARYPTAAEEIARQDVEHLLRQVNDEFYSRPGLRAPTTI
jgi:hypothetical protein